ncbi:MAG: hypothetical protein RI883_2075, partial [Bacteroidota bacterium]
MLKLFNFTFLFLIFSIAPISFGQTCTDGIQNQGETGIDCGGPCIAICPTYIVTAAGSPFGCDNGAVGSGDQTPEWDVNLTGFPSGTAPVYVVIPSSKFGECCSYANAGPSGETNQNCLVLKIILDPGAAGINFTLDGASGATDIRYMNCGATPVIAGTPICVSGVGPHYFMFCRTGTTDYSITVASIPAPTGAADVITTEGCNIQLATSGFIASSISWSSVTVGANNQYNNLISLPGGGSPGTTLVPYVDQPAIQINPITGSPGTLYYQVCGEPTINGICPAASLDIVCFTTMVSIYPDLSATPGPNVAICNGSVVGANVSASALGGTAPFTFTWSGPGGFTDVNTHVSAIDNIQAMLPGVYNVVITDATGCPSASTFVTVTSFTVDINAAAGSDVLVCRSPIPTININATVSQTGTGIWSGGTGTYNTNNTDLTLLYTPSAAELTAGSVTLTLTPTNVLGCPFTTDQVVISLPAFTSVLSAVPTNITCFGLTNGSIDLTVTGGAAPASYLWTNTAVTQDLSGLGVNSYTVTVTDVNGCTGTTSASITQPTDLILSVSNFTNETCSYSNNGIITVAGSGGTGAFTYAITSPVAGASQASGTFSGLTGTVAGTTYTIQVTDAAGCTDIITQLITEPVVLDV